MQCHFRLTPYFKEVAASVLFKQPQSHKSFCELSGLTSPNKPTTLWLPSGERLHTIHLISRSTLLQPITHFHLPPRWPFSSPPKPHSFKVIKACMKVMLAACTCRGGRPVGKFHSEVCSKGCATLKPHRVNRRKRRRCIL